MSTTNCRRSVAAMSRYGWPHIPTMPSGCAHGARCRRRCMRATTRSPTGSESFLMYENASGEVFTVYTARSEAETTQMRYAVQDKDGALFWADRGVGYVVSGGSDRERLTQVARLVYDQAEKSGG